mmetsp:Transcript_116443/g.324498  ORF Transcript_116443/g.324498 Transcript_116443/m.324498 type:complete len:285 (-) Transcript_116443:45-899(-)
MDTSLVMSAALAAAWTWDKTHSRGQEERRVDSLATAAKQVAWGSVRGVRSLNQVLPAALAAFAAGSFGSVLSSAFSLGLAELSMEGAQWLGHGELSLWRRWSLVAAVAVWRAEKLESLLQRLQRSSDVIRAAGFSQAVSLAASDPYAWVWPAFWGVARRLALVAVSSFGSVPFMLVAFPAVVLDECLWWLLATVQDLWSRKVFALPAAVDVVILPLVDLLHFVPVLVRVLLLGIWHYPGYGETSWLLVVSALAWTAHNCHTFYTTVFLDVPEQARQLLTAAAAG